MLQIQLEEALKKFVKDWKTIDQAKINYLMKYGIVQEVMKIEERKAIRRENANKAALAAEAAASPEAKEVKSPQKFGAIKSPRGGHTKKNSDLAGVQHSRYSNDPLNNKRPKTFLDSIPGEKTRGARGALHDSQMSEFSRSPKKEAASASAMKESKNKDMANSSTTFQTIGEQKKKAINFGDSSTDNGRALPRLPAAKDAPTIGNPLMMKMEF